MNALSIYRVLMSQDFDDWYDNEFKDHVTGNGDDEELTQERILQDIAQMFRVEE